MAIESPRRALSQKQIEALKPGPKRQEIADGDGLYFLLQPSGAASWACRYRVDGRLLKQTLGQYPRLGLADARKLARKARAAVDVGRNPQGDKVALRRAHVADGDADRIEVAVAAFLGGHAERKLKASSQREAGRILNGLALRWKGRKLGEITKRDIRALLDEILAGGATVMANRTLSWFRLFCTWAVERELIAVNLCFGIRPPVDEQARERVLNDSELAALWQAAAAIGGAAGGMVRMLVLSGQRLREVAQMSWSEVDLDAATWELPGARSKNGKSHVIPLAPAAVEILKGAPRFEGCDAVFTIDGKKPIAGFSLIKSRLDKALPTDIEPWRLHDLRRTFASGCAALGTPIHVVERLLNHTSGTFRGIVSVYQKHDYAPEQRKAAEAWAAHIERLLNGTVDNVVSLKRGG